MLKINIHDLEKSALALISKLRETKGDVIDIDSAFYWCIDEDGSFDTANKPQELLVGNIMDDWSDLSNAANEDRLIGYHFKCMASVLNAISFENPDIA